MRELRTEIADRKHAGQLSSQTRAPATVHRTLEQVLAAIDRLTDDTTATRLGLTGRQALEEFVFHQTAVQHWANALTVRGQLTTRRPPDADRFWHEFETRVVSP